MSWKMRWEIGWKITPIGQVSSSHYFTDTQEVMRWLEDMVDIFIYSILFIALQHHTQPILSSSRESPQPIHSHHTLLVTKKKIEYWHDMNSTSSQNNANHRRVWHPCHTHAATKLSSHRTKNEEVIGREEKSVSICEIRGRLFSARRFCEFGGRIVMLVQRLLGWCSGDRCTP